MTERAYAFAASDTDGDMRLLKTCGRFEDFVDGDAIDAVIQMIDAVDLVDADKPAVYRVSIHIEKVFDIP